MPVHQDAISLLDHEILILKNIYKKHLPDFSFAYSLICLTVEWNNKYPDKKYYRIYGSDESWAEHGTFFVIIQCGCYDVFVFSLKENSEKLYHALVNTKKINWATKRLFFYAVNVNHLNSVINAIDTVRGRISKIEDTCTWRLPKELALNLQIECPPEVYIAKLKPCQASLVNNEWPNKFENSEEYVRHLIENNGGFGVYDKKSGELAAWILRNHIGILGLLQTVNKYQKRGYACLITKVLCKDIAEKGLDPLSMTLVSNVASQKLFKKLGFQRLENVKNVELLVC